MKLINNYSYIFIGLLALAACTANDTNSERAKQDSIKHANAMAATQDTANYTVIEWVDSTMQDIGKVKQGQTVEVSWKFRNAGNKPLIIAQVQPGCGCTVAEQPKEPIAPGEQSKITAQFNSEGQHEGEHTKVVSVMANTSNGTHHQLQFRAVVEK